MIPGHAKKVGSHAAKAGGCASAAFLASPKNSTQSFPEVNARKTRIVPISC